MARCHSTFGNSVFGASFSNRGLHGRGAVAQELGFGKLEAADLEPERQARRILLQRPASRGPPLAGRSAAIGSIVADPRTSATAGTVRVA